MTRFRITNRTSAVILGVYEGETPRNALDTMARDAGHDDYTECCDVLSHSVEDGTADLLIEQVVDPIRDTRGRVIHRANGPPPSADMTATAAALGKSRSLRKRLEKKYGIEPD